MKKHHSQQLVRLNESQYGLFMVSYLEYVSLCRMRLNIPAIILVFIEKHKPKAGHVYKTAAQTESWSATVEQQEITLSLPKCHVQLLYALINIPDQTMISIHLFSLKPGRRSIGNSTWSMPRQHKLAETSKKKCTQEIKRRGLIL